MTDTQAETNLPPPANKVGGVRHALPTRHVDLPYVATPQTAVSAALDPNVDFEKVILQNQAIEEGRSRDPRANPSTYYPPSNQKHHDNNVRGQSVRSHQGIQQPGSYHGQK